MTTVDPTTQSLEAALLDQKVAGTFMEKPYAYIAVLSGADADSKMQWAIGIAVEDEQGYNEIRGEQFMFAQHAEARTFCDGMNRHIGLSVTRETEIICSTMRSR